ncbi:MAG: hypothetical protein ACODAG_12420, partial [Myxococcota bacterium]
SVQSPWQGPRSPMQRSPAWIRVEHSVQTMASFAASVAPSVEASGDEQGSHLPSTRTTPFSHV